MKPGLSDIYFELQQRPPEHPFVMDQGRITILRLALSRIRISVDGLGRRTPNWKKGEARKVIRIVKQGKKAKKSSRSTTLVVEPRNLRPTSLVIFAVLTLNWSETSRTTYLFCAVHCEVRCPMRGFVSEEFVDTVLRMGNKRNLLNTLSGISDHDKWLGCAGAATTADVP